MKIIHVVKSWTLHLFNFTISFGILKKIFFNPRSSLQRGFIEIFAKLHENEKEKKNLLASKSEAHIEQIHEKIPRPKNLTLLSL